MPETTVNTLTSMKNLIKYGGLVIISLLAVLAFVVFTDRNNESDRRGREADAKIEARIASTRLYNSDQSKRRTFQQENILTLIGLGGEKDPAVVAQSPEFAQYKEFLEQSFPYRQTSEACVNALYDDDTPDCPPASNEKGDP